MSYIPVSFQMASDSRLLEISIVWPQKVSLQVEISSWRRIKSSIMIGDILGWLMIGLILEYAIAYIS